jgi:zinc transporter ZupT
MASIIIPPALCSLIAGAATVLGSLLVLKWRDWSRRNSIYLVSFAAGFMLAAAFLHLVPEAADQCGNGNTFLAVMGGIILFHVIQVLVNFHLCRDESCELHRLGLISLLALVFHSLLDGAVITAGFHASHALGVIATLAIVFHEIPEGIVTTGILVHSGASRGKLIAGSLVVALSTPFGAIALLPFVELLSPQILGILLAVAAGSFIYIAAADLIPETHRAQRRASTMVLICGVGLLVALRFVFHSH